mmetsp:Transcript_18834/g.40830  ORF Transcript_18834/g.40830 Transcript_18834/m.40830 type:complete len:83 (+) Transcript_18834:614-862(+)
MFAILIIVLQMKANHSNDGKLTKRQQTYSYACVIACAMFAAGVLKTELSDKLIPRGTNPLRFAGATARYVLLFLMSLDVVSL